MKESCSVNVRARRRGQRGSSLLEGALVLLPLFAIFLAIIDFSLAVFLRSTFQHAVREGVRYAITYQVSGALGQDASIKQVVQHNAMGFLDGDNGLNKIKVRFFNPATSMSVEATGLNSNQPGNIVEVAVEGFQWIWLAPVGPGLAEGQTSRNTSPVTINAWASDVMGGLPVGSVNPPAR